MSPVTLWTAVWRDRDDRAALVALYGTEEGRDATAEALACAWEHWPR